MQLDERAARRRPSRAFETLTKSALALPGLAGLAPVAHADGPATEWQADAAFSWYKEDPLPFADWDQSRGGSRERYSIYAFQLDTVAPITNQIDASFDFVFETMSGASPWYVVPDTSPGNEGRPLTVMTGATIEDTRIDGQFAVDHYFDRARLGLSGGFSTENDYLSGNFGFNGERSYNDKNTTLGLGVSFAWDTISPTDADIHQPLPGQPDFTPCNPDCNKKTITLSASLTQLLSKTAMIQVGATYKNGKGFLSDPYKDVFFVFNTVEERRNDRRPELRNQGTFLVRYRQFIEPASAALHVDVQGYLDNWGVRSLGVETAWYQSFGEVWQIVPSFRYYSQSQADFYAAYFPLSALTTEDYWTSDYRMSPFGALQAGLSVKARIDRWPKWAVWYVDLSYDYYWSAGNFALGNVEVASPALVDWGLLSFGIGGRF